MKNEFPGLRQAVQIANTALKNSLGYKAFAAKQGNKIKRVEALKDFFSLPVANKSNYIHKFFNRQFFTLPKLHSQDLYASSGSSGSPTFWFRDRLQEEKGADLHELIFTKIFKLKKNEDTLIIVAFAMGVWVAGNYTAACARILNKRGYNLTTVTPGIEVKDILLILKDIGNNFKNVILAGYPSFVMDVLQEAKKLNINIPKELKILTAGDSFSEEWRTAVCELINSSKTPQNVLSLYGSADACVMGFETPLTISVRRLCEKNKVLAKLLFGEQQKQPGFFQYHPDHIFFEAIVGELAITARAAFPLVRYNIRDQGQVLEQNEFRKILSRANCLNSKTVGLLKEWDLPFVVKGGRTDVAVTFYALNIYPEHLEYALKDKQLGSWLSGKYKIYNQVAGKNRTEHLNIEIETSKKARPGKRALDFFSHKFAENLSKVNIEYRKLLNMLGKKAWPRIKLTHKFKANAENKGMLFTRGKKTIMA